MTIFQQLGKQKGFSLLEAMLAIILVLAASLGVVELYLSAKGHSDLQKAEDIAQQVASATSQMLSATNDPNYSVSTEDVVNSGLLPSSVAFNQNIYTPFGTVDVDAPTENGGHLSYTVTLNTLPRDQAISFCRDMVANFAILSGGTVLTDPSDCSSSNFTSSTSNSVAIAYPKAAWGSE